MNTEKKVKEAFDLAAERFAAVNVDVNSALEKLQKISLSLHCWQADDVTGFENPDGSLSGGIQVTGNYPGKARNIDEVRADILTANSFIPGTHRLNLHEIPFPELDGVGEREQYETRFQLHFFLTS